MTTINAEMISKNVAKTDEIKGWYWYFNILVKKVKVLGKYLFFSKSIAVLETIMIEEMENGGFWKAKINTDQHKIGDEYVLCLYYTDDSRKYELANKYKNNPELKYRYWKSDEDTLKGKYSKDFLEKASAQGEFTNDR